MAFLGQEDEGVEIRQYPPRSKQLHGAEGSAPYPKSLERQCITIQEMILKNLLTGYLEFVDICIHLHVHIKIGKTFGAGKKPHTE